MVATGVIGFLVSGPFVEAYLAFSHPHPIASLPHHSRWLSGMITLSKYTGSKSFEESLLLYTIAPAFMGSFAIRAFGRGLLGFGIAGALCLPIVFFACLAAHGYYTSLRAERRFLRFSPKEQADLARSLEKLGGQAGGLDLHTGQT